jgi:hypothetical protein
MYGNDHSIATIDGINKQRQHVCINIISIEVWVMKNVFYLFLDSFGCQGCTFGIVL